MEHTCENGQKSTCKVCNRIKARRSRVKHRYGISYEEYLKYVEADNTSCSICDKQLVLHSSDTQETVCLDHCHATGKIRGVLCNRCNIAIGILGDNPEKFKRALTYLEERS